MKKAMTILTLAIAMALLGQPEDAGAISWDDNGNSANKNWSLANNWVGNVIPTSSDPVFIGNVVSAIGDQTIVNQDFVIASLVFSNLADADTAGNFLDVNGLIHLNSAGSILTVSQHGSGAGTTALDAHNLTITSGTFKMEGGRVIMALPGAGNNALVDIKSGGLFSGWGTLRFQDGGLGGATNQLVNRGTLSTARPLGPTSTRYTLTIESSNGTGDAQIDLSPTVNGVVNVVSQTTLNVDMPLDSFFGTINMSPGAILDMSDAWQLQSFSDLNINAGSPPVGVSPIATIRGANLTQVAADININSGTLVMEADYIAANNFDNDLVFAANTGLQIDGSAFINKMADLRMGASNTRLIVNGDLTINSDNSDLDWDGTGGHVTTINDGGLLNFGSDVDIERGPTAVDNAFDGTLNLNGNSELRTDFSFLHVGGTINIDGTGTAVLGGTGQIVLDAGALINFQNNSSLRFKKIATIDGNLSMNNSNTALIIDRDVTINDTVFDWDGTGGHVTTINDFGKLIVNSDDISGSGVSDNSFTGTVNIVGGSLTVNSAGGWKLQSDGRINTTGSSASAIGGTQLTLEDNAGINAAGTRTTCTSAIVFASAGVSTVVGSGKLVFLGDATFQGGSTHVGSGTLSFGGNITVNGAQTIDMPNGIVSLDGSPGLIGNTINLNNDLTVNASMINQLNNTYGINTLPVDEIININNPNTTLTINLTNPSHRWTLGKDAILNISAGPTIRTSLAGSKFNIEGEVNVSRRTRFVPDHFLFANGTINLNGSGTVNGRAAISGGDTNVAGTVNVDKIAQLGSDIVIFESTAVVNLPQADDVLRVNRDVTIHSGATFNGAGKLQVLSPGAVTLRNNANVGVTLENLNDVHIGSSPGTATVDNFTQGSGGTLFMEIGGLVQGANYDSLNINSLARCGRHAGHHADQRLYACRPRHISDPQLPLGIGGI